MSVRTIRLSALALLLSLVIAACGGTAAPDSASQPADTAAATEAPAAGAAATAAPTEEVAAPAEATLAPVEEPAPAEAVTTTTESTSTNESAGGATGSDGAARTFTIVPERSEAQYEVDEEFLGQSIQFVTAIGKTQSINGSLEVAVDGTSVTLGANEFTVDLRTLTSDRPRRDAAIRRDWLASDTYPLAVFKANAVTELPADAALGQPVSFKLNGDMTIREVTNPLTWDVTATLDGDSLTGTARTFLLMRDFGFEPPAIAGMLKVTDGVTVTVNFDAEAQ